MHWKLVFGLSLFGLAIGAGSVSLIPPNAEPFCWLVAFLISAYAIARVSSDGHFLYGFLVGIVNSIWVTGAHVLFVATYLAQHTKEASMLAQMPVRYSPRLMMAVIGPIVGAISGVIIGLLALLAGKILQSKPADRGRGDELL